ncbi:MAG: hypothetical protein AAFR45_09025 [Pseudomonadota bacterium]
MADQASENGERRGLMARIWSSDDLLAETAKIMIGGLLAASWIFGYSYANSFYGMFGISLFQLEMSLFEFIFRGLFFFISLESATYILIILVAFTGVMLLAHHSRIIIVEIVGYFLAFCLLTGMSISLGSYMASVQAKALENGAGRVAACAVSAEDSNPREVALQTLIEQAGQNQRLRFIAKDKTNHYFLITPNSAAKLEDEWVKSYAVPSKNIVFCSVSSPFARSFGGFDTGN